MKRRFTLQTIATVFLLSMYVGTVNSAEDEQALIDAQMTRRTPEVDSRADSINFPVACSKTETQRYVQQALFHLHAGDVRIADWCFDAARTLEPDCAMAWWGLAVANADNRSLARYFIARAEELSSGVSGRESDWIDAFSNFFDEGTDERQCRLHLVNALDRIVTEYPEDTEAIAFLVRQFILNRSFEIQIPFTSAASFLVDDLLRRNPSHPAHLHRINLWAEESPTRAAESAEWVMKSMPQSPTAVAAAGRIMKVLGRFEDSRRCLLNSVDEAIDRMQRYRLGPGDLDGFAQNVEDLARLFADDGDVSIAIDLAIQLIQVAHVVPAKVEIVPELPHDGHAEFPPASTNLTVAGQRLLIELLVQEQRWGQLIKASSLPILASETQEIVIRKAYGLALAYAGVGNFESVTQQQQMLVQSARNLLSAHAVDQQERDLQFLVQDYLTSVSSVLKANRRRGGGRPGSGGGAGTGAGRGLGTGAGRGSRSASGRQRGQRMPGTAARSDGQGPSNARELFGEVDSPVIWVPTAAPDFSLPDHLGENTRLSALRGRPVVVVFFLGAGCPHCIEQLQTFAPLHDEFRKADVNVIAVSTDTVEGLQKTFKMAGADEAIPFQLVSDQSLKSFRKFGAFDQRNSEPLHGTFLVDSTGRLLWQNISVEPFMATSELLDEVKRLQQLSANSGQ